MHRFGCIAVMTLVVLAAPVSADKKKPDFPPWKKVGEGLEATEGFWNFHQDKKKTKFLVEIPRARIGKPFLMATTISGGTTMRGRQWNDWLLMWKVHDKRLVLLERNMGIRVKKGSDELKEAIQETYRDRVLAAYPIVAKGPKGGYVMDGRRFFAYGATQFFGGFGRSKDASLAKFEGSKNFPSNTEIRVTLPRRGSGTLLTLAYSISALPKSNYKPRVADDRIGYFTTVLKDFSEDNDDDRRLVRYVNRWHLEKADKKLPVSEPKQPIIFYIEKTVPVRFRRAVREGILEWNKAFEKVGFYNAIVVHQQTRTRFADLDPEDIRYNFFRWIYSESPFAMGPSRVDPRTGQILDADIIMDDEYIRFTLKEYRLTIKQIPTGVLSERDGEALAKHPFARLGIGVGKDPVAYAIPGNAPRPDLAGYQRRAFCSLGKGARHQLACCALHFASRRADAPVNPATGKKDDIPDEILQQFIKDTVMHEVGHTLGLRHNFKASIYRDYDEINSEEKPADITASVMDYNPLAIAPDGRPQGNWSMRTIGPYDYWAIEYGYTEKDKELAKVTARVAEKGLDYGTDEDLWSYDPYINQWDLGADPLGYAKERVALMKRLRPELEERAVEKGERYNRLRRALNMQFGEAMWAAGLAARYVGGEHVHRDHRGDPDARPPMVPVSAEKQREALRFVCAEFLSGRYFDFEADLLRKGAPDFWADDFLSLFFGGHEYPFLDYCLSVQASAIYGLTSPSRLTRVLDARYKTDDGADIVTVPEIFDAIEKAVFADLEAAVAQASTNRKPALSDLQRNLQREYVSHLTYILLREGRWPAQVQTLVRYYVKRLAKRVGDALETAQGAGVDVYTVAHLDECKTRLTRALEASYELR